MTDYESFREQLKNSLQKFVGRDAMLGYSEFYKNGGYCYEGICLRGSQADMMPILNIREYYQYFLEHNRNLDEVMVKVKKELADAEHTEADLLWRVRPFEEIRKNICLGLVHYETNRQRLKDLVHERFLDLAVVFYVAVFKEGKFYASMLITGTLAEWWGMDGRALYELALENAGKQPVVTIRLQANEHLPEGMFFSDQPHTLLWSRLHPVSGCSPFACRKGKERPVHHSCGHPRRSPCSCWRKDGYRIPEGEGGRIFKAGEKRSGLAVRTSVSLHCQTGCYCGSPAIENAATESGNGKESCRPAGRSVPAVFFTAVSYKTFPPLESPDTAPWRSRRE